MGQGDGGSNLPGSRALLDKVLLPAPASSPLDQPIKLSDCGVVTGLIILDHHGYPFAVLPQIHQIQLHDGMANDGPPSEHIVKLLLHIMRMQSAKDKEIEKEWTVFNRRVVRRFAHLLDSADPQIIQRDSHMCVYQAYYMIDAMMGSSTVAARGLQVADLRIFDRGDQVVLTPAEMLAIQHNLVSRTVNEAQSIIALLL